MNLDELSDEQIRLLYRQFKPQQAEKRDAGIKDSPVGGFVRGLRDPIDAGAQMLVHALPDSVVRAGDALGSKLADWGLPVERTNHANGSTVDDVNRRAETDYQENWRRGEQDGIDWGRIAGNVAGTLPVARLFPIGGATLGARAIQGAKMGAGLGVLQPTDTADPDASFWASKAQQAGLGAAFGAAGAPVGDMLAKGAGALVQKARQGAAALQNRGTANISVTVDNALRDAGIDVAAMPAGVRDSLRNDVAKAMSAGQRIAPDALSRMADARTVGVTLTKGQATRDPAQYQFEQNTRGIAGAGEPLQRRFAEQNAQLVSGAGQGASSLSSYQGGARLTDALRESDRAAQSVVGEAYNAARAKVGAGTELPPQLLAQKAGEVLETFGSENVPGVVVRRLQSYGILGGQQTKSFTVEEADRLRKVISANFDPGRKAEAAALSAIRAGIDDAENALAGQGSQIGEEAAQAFAKARTIAKNRFQTLEKVDALRAAVDGAEPDKFVLKHIVNAPVGQVRELNAVLRAAGDPSLVEEMRGQVVAYLKGRAVNGADDEYAKFSQSAYRKAMSEVGPEKMALLFSPQERFRLNALGRTASAIQVQPAGAAVNSSNTGAAIMNLASRIPYANAVVRPLQSAATSARVSAAMHPAISAGAQPMPEALRRLLQHGGMSGAMSGGLLGGAFGSL